MAVTSKRIRVIGNGLWSALSSGTTTLSVTYQSTFTWELHEIRHHMTTAAAGNSTFIAYIDSSGGVAHNVELVRQNINTVKDLHYQPSRPVILASGDALKINWLNATTQKYGTEIIFSKRQ